MNPNVEERMEFADSVAVTTREDWPDLRAVAVANSVNTIQEMLADTGADNVILVPATGSGSGFDGVKQALDAEGISYTEAPDPLPLGQDEFTAWGAKTFRSRLGRRVHYRLRPKHRQAYATTRGEPYHKLCD